LKMKIKIKVIGFYKKYFPAPQFETEIEQGARVTDLLGKLGLQDKLPFICILNGKYAKPDVLLSPDDEITIAPIVGGG